MNIKDSVILQKIFNTDWLFGYNNPVEKRKLTNDWFPYAPTDESQRYSRFDPWDCTSRAKMNVLEFLFNYFIKHNMLSEKAMRFLHGENCLEASYFDENGKINFLDKFIGILSDTKPGVGNTFSTPAKIIRKYGLVPETAFPWSEHDLNKMSANDYYNKKSIEHLMPLGKEFLEIFNLFYEVVSRKDFGKAIWFSPIEVGVKAWSKKGEYYVSDGGVNHDTVLGRITGYNKIFDSYSPFIKKLILDYQFMSYGYIWFVEEKKKNMILKDKHRYTALVKKKDDVPSHKEYGFAKAGKLIVGDRDEILNLFVDETAGNIKGRVITVREEDFNSVPHYDLKLQKIKE